MRSVLSQKLMPTRQYIDRAVHNQMHTLPHPRTRARLCQTTARKRYVAARGVPMCYHALWVPVGVCAINRYFTSTLVATLLHSVLNI